LVPVVTASEMREIDRKTIDDYGLPSLVLMERAGLAVVKRIIEALGGNRKFLILAGGGNNGGDGLVVARNLHNLGLEVTAYLLSPPDRLSPDCKRQFEIAGKMGVKVVHDRTPRKSKLDESVIVDAILGTGLNKPVRAELARLINSVNRAEGPVVSVDIPSGISADTGEVMGSAVMANLTVTFGLPKRGHLLNPGREYTGRLFVEDIGFPPELTRGSGFEISLIERNDASSLIPSRHSDSHKGTYGHVLVVGGSKGKTGALRLAGKAALRTGSGLVTLATDDVTASNITPAVLEEMILHLDLKNPEKTLEEALSFLDERADLLVAGPGWGRDEERMDFMVELISHATVPMVIDADGLYALSVMGHQKLGKLMQKLRGPAVLTPHHGEMARLLGGRSSDIRKDPIGLVRKFSAETGSVLVLKGAPTIISTPEGRVFINGTGNPGMATAGTGDILAGMIGSLIGQGLPPVEASILGVYLHGLAGDLGADELGEHSLTAGELLQKIPDAISTIQK